MTTSEEIRKWFDVAASEGATHLLTIVDEFDWEDYPVFVMPGENVDRTIKLYDQVNMQRIMEVYRISLGWDAQSKGRVWNL
jgi:hypothetical protein